MSARRGAMAPALLPSPPHPKPPLLHHNSSPARPLSRCAASRRDFTIHTTVAAASAAMSHVVAAAAEEAPPLLASTPTPPSLNGGATSLLGGIANTRSWSQYYGSGFSIRVPPSFDDVLEPEVGDRSHFHFFPLVRVSFAILGPNSRFDFDYIFQDFNAAMTYYGDKAKVRAYAARFASPDR